MPNGAHTAAEEDPSGGTLSRLSFATGNKNKAEELSRILGREVIPIKLSV